MAVKVMTAPQGPIADGQEFVWGSELDFDAVPVHAQPKRILGLEHVCLQCDRASLRGTVQ